MIELMTRLPPGPASRPVGLPMSTGEVLWLVLVGFIAVWACDLFGIWEALASYINRRWRNERTGK